MSAALTAATSTVKETQALGAALAEIAQPRDIVLLSGDLGSGKTAFVQGFAGGLGVLENVVSPTFTIARDYEGRLRLHHLDVYRLDHLQEAIDLGLAELTDDGGVTLIEWGEVVIPALPPDYLEVRFSYGEDDDDRVIGLVPVGVHWVARMGALAEVLAPWRGGR
ncbi:MAG: tRNA (adenosine(37)-N6)-threonylcarbamoyltransferase complex ATPase subunit type 1 TsaE [Acidimicrobiales bacterium]